MCQHTRQKVNETKKRSLMKTVSFRIIEVVMDIIIILALLQSGLPELIIAGAGAILVESSCGIGYYIWERLWNRIDWGRIIIDE